MGGRLRGWQALSGRERLHLVLMTGLGLPLAAAAIRLFGYVRTRHWVELWSPAAGSQPTLGHDVEQAQRLAELANIAGRHGPITATCLRQALLLYWLLRRRGLAPELKIGVRRQGDLLDAHAWVELDGHALGQMSVRHSPFA